MHVQNLILVVSELVLGATNDAKVGRGLLGETNWYLKFGKLVVVSRVLHLLEHDALFHLADVLLLNHAHQRSKLLQNKVRIEIVILAHALGEEALTSLLGQERDGV